MTPPPDADPPPLRVLLVDDEALARLRLARLVAECPSPRARVVGEAGNATQALVWLAGHECDVLLADIRMPGRDGLQLAAEVARLPSPPPAVVFVTAHAEHALAAFDLAAADYLTKPVRRERLQAALQRAAARRSQHRAPTQPLPGSPAAAAEEPVLVVSASGRVLHIPAAEVLYFKAELKYVTLRTARASYLLDDALSDLEQRLGSRFLRVHRNALVARRAMRALERRSLGGGRGYGAAGDADDATDEAGGAAAAEGTDAGFGWAVRVHPVGEWLAVSRRQVAAVREAMGEDAGR